MTQIWISGTVFPWITNNSDGGGKINEYTDRLIRRLLDVASSFHASNSRSYDVVIDAIDYIHDHEDAKPGTAPRGESTLEECVAAMNRIKFNDADDWEAIVGCRSSNQAMGGEAVRIVGEGIVARERRAKGGSV